MSRAKATGDEDVGLQEGAEQGPTEVSAISEHSLQTESSSAGHLGGPQGLTSHRPI